MSVIRNLPIARKFWWAFGLVCLLCAVQGVFAIFGILRLNTSMTNVLDKTVPAVRLLDEMRVDITQTRRSDLALLLCQTPTCIASYKAKRETAGRTFNASMEKYAALISRPDERELADVFRQKFAQYQEISAGGRVAAEEGKVDQALKIFMDPSA